MAPYATIMIEKHALPSVQESIAIGKHVLERKLAAYTSRLTQFEQTRKMDTLTFLRLFEHGELEDHKEWIEWEHLANVVTLLQKKIRDLEAVKYES